MAARTVWREASGMPVGLVYGLSDRLAEEVAAKHLGRDIRGTAFDGTACYVARDWKGVAGGQV